MGRRKIEIEPLTDDRNRSVTFVKRKAGLFKKAYELSVLCDVDLAVIVVGSNNKVYEFSTVDTNELLKCYRTAPVHESKLLENYGNYKKRSHLKTRSYSAVNDDLAQDGVDNEDSEDESEESTPKRIKKEPNTSNVSNTSNTSIYSQQSSVTSRFAQLAAQKQQNLLDQDSSLHRPVLRVQIPSDNKSDENLARTVTDIEGLDDNKSVGQSLHQNAIAYSLRKFKSPDVRKPPLPLPTTHKSQTLSPLSATHPLPINANAAQYYSLPPPSPSGNFSQSILPTPVFNQVFNQLFMNPMGGVGNTLMPLSAGGLNGQTSAPPLVASSNGNASNINTSFPLSAPRPQTSDTTAANVSANSSGLDIEIPKFKAPFHQQLANGEQTPMSGLPSRYMNDIFPSPSNFYPSQEWPTGTTPYSSSMSHYFVGMVPSASAATPLQAYSSTTRNPHQPTSKPGLVAMPSLVAPAGKSGRKPSLSLADGIGLSKR